ncbi:hypothetical protein F4778DRAFT_717401 [Xylariomycetidae sp. FL2044]|nr:hypothetical protein F4778DRAFT_717401 [Xylariomycetidae sp. FL2044]
MGVQSWMEESIAHFFKWRPKPSRQTLDEHAKALFNASSVHPVGMQGSLSYTVVVDSKTIVSFRIPESGLGEEMDKLGHKIHGDTAPAATNHGMIGNGADEKPLHVCSMPYLPGKSYLEVASPWPQLSETATDKQLTFNTHLARYFARSWLHPQPVDEAQLQEKRDFVLQKLAKLKETPGLEYLKPHIEELESENGVSSLYSQKYPQTLNHGDLNQTNLLVDDSTRAITGIIDWSRATIGPFGLEYASVRRLNGNANERGWTDYTDRGRFEAHFWDEFWKATGIDSPEERANLKRSTILAGKLGVMLDFAFFRTLSGTVLDGVVPEPCDYLKGFLENPSWDQLVFWAEKKDDKPKTDGDRLENAEHDSENDGGLGVTEVGKSGQKD